MKRRANLRLGGERGRSRAFRGAEAARATPHRFAIAQHIIQTSPEMQSTGRRSTARGRRITAPRTGGRGREALHRRAGGVTLFCGWIGRWSSGSTRQGSGRPSAQPMPGAVEARPLPAVTLARCHALWRRIRRRSLASCWVASSPVRAPRRALENASAIRGDILE